MPFRKIGHTSLVSMVRAPEDWFEALESRGTVRIARKEAKNVIEGYSPDEFLFTHNTIIASVDVDHEQDWMISADTQKYINDNKDCWERGVIANDWRSFVGAENYQEHVQVPSLSKGKIVDAALRDMGDTLYTDILVATSRKHSILCRQIHNNEINAMSMGCICDYTICGRCGNKAVDETELCTHIAYEKGNTFIGPDGRTRIIAELCGHRNDPGSVKFIEASWVANPAFRGAVTRNILDIPTLGLKATRKQFFIPSTLPNRPGARSRVAIKGEYVQDDTIPPEAHTNPNKSVERSDDFKDIEDRLNEYQGEDGAHRPFDIRHNPQNKPVQFLEENLIFSGVESSTQAADSDFARRFRASSFTNSQLKKIREGLRLFRQGGFNHVAKQGFTGIEILSMAYFIDRFRPRKGGYEAIPLPHYEVVKKVGSISKYPSEISYLKKASEMLGRKFRSKAEAAQVLTLARLFDLPRQLAS